MAYVLSEPSTLAQQQILNNQLTGDQQLMRYYRTRTDINLNDIINTIVTDGFNINMWKRYKDAANRVLMEREINTRLNDEQKMKYALNGLTRNFDGPNNPGHILSNNLYRFGKKKINKFKKEISYLNN